MDSTISSSPAYAHISGSTTLCAILADPIHHVRLPHTFNTLMGQWNKDVLLVPIHVGAGELPRVIDGLRHTKNMAGFAVTVPHKTAALGLCDEVSARAQAVGAINVVRREASGRLVGDILDSSFSVSVRSAGCPATIPAALCAASARRLCHIVECP